MATKVFTEHLSPQAAIEVERLLEAGVARGFVQRSTKPIEHVIWRYEAIPVRAILTCYKLHKKRRNHSLVVDQDDSFGRLAMAGDWDAFETALDASSEDSAVDMVRSVMGGAMASLELLDAKVAAEPRAAARALTRDDLSPHQGQVFDAACKWARAPTALLSLGGYAGTGKSTLVAMLARELSSQRIAFCAPTGKAALVMREKLQAAGIPLDEYYCGTLHRLIYQAKLDKRTGRSRGFEKIDRLDYDLIIADEASMIGEQLYADLSSFDVPILAVGDHGQLAPVQGRSHLMASPDLCLTEIHRQAIGHPIVRYATAVREGRDPFEELGDDPRVRGVRVGSAADMRALLGEFLSEPRDAAETVVLCYTNHTRVWLNKLIRKSFGFEGELGVGELGVGELVICLRNAYFDGQLLANGSRGTVESVSEAVGHHLLATIRHDEDRLRVTGSLLRQQFGRPDTIDAYDKLGFDAESWHDVGLLYDYGYAMTVHKSQGSQFRRVVLILERPGSIAGDDWRRWVYTGVTRAVDELIVVERA